MGSDLTIQLFILLNILFVKECLREREREREREIGKVCYRMCVRERYMVHSNEV